MIKQVQDEIKRVQLAKSVYVCHLT